MANRDVEVMVTYQPARSSSVGKPVLEAFYGVCADDPIILDDQGGSEALERLAGAFD